MADGNVELQILAIPSFLVLRSNCAGQPLKNLALLALSSTLEDVPACEYTVQMLCDVWTQPQRSNSRTGCSLSIAFNTASYFPQTQLTSIYTPSVLNQDSMRFNSLKAVFLFKYVLGDWKHYEFNLREDVCLGIHNAIQSRDLFSHCDFAVGYIRFGKFLNR